MLGLISSAGVTRRWGQLETLHCLVFAPSLLLRDQLKTEVAELKNKVETLESRYV